MAFGETNKTIIDLWLLWSFSAIKISGNNHSTITLTHSPKAASDYQICFHKWLYFDSSRQSAASAEPMRPLRCINKVSWHAKLLLLFIFSVVPLWPLVSSIPCISHPPRYPVSLHDRDLHCNCKSYLMCQRKILLDTIPRTIIDS